MGTKSKRILNGLLLISIVSITYFLNLDIPLYIFCIIAVLYDIFYSKIIDYSSLVRFSFLLIISSLFFFLIPYHLVFFIFIFLFLFNFYSKIYLKDFFIISLSFFFFCVSDIYSIDRSYIYIIIFLSFLNDTVAYFFGNLLKGPLIIPQISPNKTWSGSIISSLISLFFIIFFFDFNIFYSFILSISFFFGDIYFSYFKRQFAIKDYSNLIPGHGGLLDRIDSMFLANIFLLFLLNI